MLPLLILIATIWLAVVIGCVSICAMAARGDAMMGHAPDGAPIPRYDTLPSTAGAPRMRLVHGGGAIRRGRLTGHVAR